MTKHTWCPICKAKILTIDEELKKICSECQKAKQHADDFHKKYDIKKGGKDGNNSEN